jgi:RES domain-containing protein
MICYRSFWLSKEGGNNPLEVFSEYQRKGRHDIPDRSTVLYVSLDMASAIAEQLQDFRNKEEVLPGIIFGDTNDVCLALAKIEFKGERVVDLTDPNNLTKFNLSPADIATHDREKTQKVSRTIYDSGYDGFLWWSALEAKWTNGTFFAARIRNKVKILNTINLNIKIPEVQEAVEFLKINIAD